MCAYKDQNKYIVGGVYIPPDSEVEKYQELNLCIEEVMITYPHHTVTHVRGSFPIMRDGVNNGVRSAASCHSDCTYNNTLYQTVDIENTKANVLDLCFSNIKGFPSERSLDFLFEGL